MQCLHRIALIDESLHKLTADRDIAGSDCERRTEMCDTRIEATCPAIEPAEEGMEDFRGFIPSQTRFRRAAGTGRVTRPGAAQSALDESKCFARWLRW